MPIGASRLGFWFITPTPAPPPPPEPPVNPTPIDIIADYIVVQYSFTDGKDLDTRTKMTVPDIGGDYVGWGRSNTQGTPAIVSWGGDNTGTGVESVLINVDQYKLSYPEDTTFTVQFNCFWYSQVGTQPVSLYMTLYIGGTMVKSGYTWTNPTATSTQSLTSTGKVITASSQLASYNGESLGYITYNVETGIGTLDIYS